MSAHHIWEIFDEGTKVGEIRWHEVSGRYCMYPADGVALGRSKLKEIADFLEERERRGM